MEDFSASPLVNTDLNDLRWLAGSWSGRVDGDEMEEVWTGPLAGSMMGMFRHISDGSVRFYEFMTITRESKHTNLTIKHFNPDLVGWEEKDGAARFILTQVTGERAVFHQVSADKPLWLVYESPDGSTLRVYFRPVENSPVGDSEFLFHRSRSAG